MPNAGEEERQKQIAIGVECPVTVSTQRNVNIISEPTGEADVPAGPELAQAGCQVGVVEVQDKVKPHELGDPAGHVGIAAEIEKYLPTKRNGCGEQRWGAESS